MIKTQIKKIIKNKLVGLSIVAIILIFIDINISHVFTGAKFDENVYQTSNLVKTELYTVLPEKFNDIDFNDLVFTSKKSKIVNTKDNNCMEGIFNYYDDEKLIKVKWKKNAEKITITSIIEQTDSTNTEIYNSGELVNE